jgi:hypothetical protein
MRKAWLGGVAMWFGLLMCGAARAADPVPPALQDWRDWVLQGHETRACPVRDGEEVAPDCRWPGRLALEIDAQGARFSQLWTLDVAQRVPLPGDAQVRPIEVQVDGRDAPVVLVDGVPMLALEAGRWRVDGRFEWARRPPTLALPADIALLSLRLDGNEVARPERNEDDALVLGAVGTDESDDLQIEVQRLLADGAPQLLLTRVVLSVSGTPREQVLPVLLPDGFAPVALESQIPARIEPDGRLRTQLRSGRWLLTLVARALAPREEFALPPDGGLWPAQEIWQFRADPGFRVAQLTGLPGVDPTQVQLADWNAGIQTGGAWQQVLADGRQHPAYLFTRDDTAKLEISLRGLPAQRPPRLQLQRELWLDFDGDAFTAIDRIGGELEGAARLDLQEPWQMQRAQSGAQGLLVTRGPQPGTSGVELRGASLQLEVDARVARDGIARASGWTQPFDGASFVLHLPPGYRLLAATGADHAGGSWWSAWSLADLFLLALTALLAWRLGGAPFCALAALWGVLAWHEPDAPRWSVFLLLLFALAARHLVAGWPGRLVRGARNLAALAVVLFGLGFAATGLRLALYPQLEQYSVTRPGEYQGYGSGMDRSAVEVMAVMEEPMPASSPVPQAEQNLAVQDAAQGMVQRQEAPRMKKADLFNYPADAIVQTGGARPNWQWHRHQIGWNGPLLPDDEFGLLLSPPPLTRLWRLAAVLLLGALAWQLGRRWRLPASAPPARSAAVLPALLLAAAGFGATDARAQATPHNERLDELRAHLLLRDEPCRPQCGALGALTVVADPARLTLALQAQAQAEVVWPLPRPDASLTLVAVRIDGAEASALRDAEGSWVRLERGVHRVELDYAPDGGRWRIAFPHPPAAVELRAPGFEAIGLDRGKLVGDTLELIAPRAAPAAGAGDAPTATTVEEAIPPFVRVERYLSLDQFWEVAVVVRRVAPARGGINLAIPLLAGEQPYQNAPPIRDGRAIVSLPAGTDVLQWRSRLVPAAEFALLAGDGRAYAEEWHVAVAPLLHVEASGLPESSGDGTQRRFLPLPGETLTLAVTRPEAVEGARIALENVALSITPGQRARNARLTFELRATQPGQHRIALPPGAELLAFNIGGEPLPRVLEDGALLLPVRPGVQQVAVEWREPVAMGARVASPALDLDASASNLRLSLGLPDDRWLLLTRGPQVGPAVLLWGELAVMLLAAWLLARFGGTPLRLHHWLLLGLGFSTLSWVAAAIVAGWLLALGWRARHPELVERRVFPWLQLALFGLAGVALIALLVAIPYGLLGRPDMHVAGNGSTATSLQWFADRSQDGALPVVQAFSVPLWVYKLAILAWSIWLANALIGWLRWGWTSLGNGGWWRPIWRRRTPAAVTPAASEPAPPPPAA